MSKKYLVIINEKYPYEKGESFMENEIPLINGFNKIYICPCSVLDFNVTRNIDHSSVKVINIDSSNSFYKKILKLLTYIRSLFNPLVIKEICLLIRNKKISYKTVKSLISFVSFAENRIYRVKKQLDFDGIKKSDKIIFYSYWMDFHSYVAINLRKLYPNSICVSRCHGYDLYEYRNKNNYIPLRKYILQNMNIIFSISVNGKNYLEKNYPKIRKNIIVSRLGTNDYDIREVGLNRKTLKIVSCSWISPVKRVERIVNTLSQIKDINISWTHYGDGVLFEQLREYAKENLKGNISFDLPGATNNKELMEKYKTKDFHIFVNVSESEGVPVSIMEAMSFGIPVIATDVGGVNEIVIDKYNGLLISKDFKDEDLVKCIREFYNMTQDEYMNYRKNSRLLWEQEYNAKKNYEKFYKSLIIEGNKHEQMVSNKE
ncbi:Glycosyltransferase involved in cell wall bisynthesis [Clostridium cochlearium]|uniref:Glycosyltransferase involved in cell wall bisynthesis n=1 Tax=Clostridium cochlearium TaxID=1494 RepID=A0ABY0QMN4_CLOCO|nr:glycosyltransferase [Clostridium cochlearium]SDL28520.1 Glycosyltransferase involved in cell wall bisynthesis [Clostridium cochlearium]